MSVKVLIVGLEPERMVRLKAVVKSLKRLGLTPVVLKPVEVRFKPRLIGKLLKYIVVAFKLFIADFKVVHGFNVPDVILMPVLLKKCVFIYDVRSPWGVEVKALGWPRILGFLAEIMEKALTRRADVVLAANTVLRNRALVWGAKKAFVVPNLPDESFKPSVPPDEFKKKRGLENNRIVLFVGKFTRVEGVPLLLETFKLIAAKRRDIVLVMVGDGPLMNYVKNRICELKLMSRVVLTGWVKREEVANWISIADVCVVPRVGGEELRYYTSENIWKLNEYLSIGKIVVASGISDAWKNPNLIIVNPTPQSLAEAVINSLNLKAKRIEHFTWERISEKIIRKAYLELGLLKN